MINDRARRDAAAGHEIVISMLFYCRGSITADVPDQPSLYLSADILVSVRSISLEKEYWRTISFKIKNS